MPEESRLRVHATWEEGAQPPTDAACQHFTNRNTDGLLCPLQCRILMEKTASESMGVGRSCGLHENKHRSRVVKPLPEIVTV